MNRRQRRSAAKTSQSQSRASTTAAEPNVDVPLARPPPPPPRKSKTLYEIAAEKQAELSKHGQPFSPSFSSSSLPKSALKTKELHLHPNGSLSDNPPPLTTSPLTYTSTSTYPVSSSVDDLPSHSQDDSSSIDLPALLDTLFTSLTLSILHFTLSFLAAHQYAQTLEPFPLVFQSAFLAFPLLTFLIHLAHGHLIRIPYLFVPPPPQGTGTTTTTTQQTHAHPRPLQALFLLAANVSGCRLIALTNDAGYYAVMKKAPAIGVLWVWSVLELGLAGAVAGVLGPAAYAAWWGYGLW